MYILLIVEETIKRFLRNLDSRLQVMKRSELIQIWRAE